MTDLKPDKVKYVDLLRLLPPDDLLNKICVSLAISKAKFCNAASEYNYLFAYKKLPLTDYDLTMEGIIFPANRIKFATVRELKLLQEQLPIHILHKLTYISAANKMLRQSSGVATFSSLLHSNIPPTMEDQNRTFFSDDDGWRMESNYELYFHQHTSFIEGCEILDELLPSKHVWRRIVRDSVIVVEEIVEKEKNYLIERQIAHRNRTREGFQSKKKGIKNAVINRDGGFLCKTCGEDNPAKLDMDHIIPLGKAGGTNDIGNIQVLCKTCHRHKHTIENRMKKAKY